METYRHLYAFKFSPDWVMNLEPLVLLATLVLCQLSCQAEAQWSEVNDELTEWHGAISKQDNPNLTILIGTCLHFNEDTLFGARRLLVK